MAARDQDILVFEAKLLNEVGSFQGFTFETNKYLNLILATANNRFIPRQAAETNAEYKQIIPYIILKYRDSVYTYVRGNGSGEQRLKQKYSIGLGGHIENKDRTLFNFKDGFSYYLHAAKREIEEEIILESGYSERIVALINDDTNDVGRVHFGVCHIWELEKPSVKERESVIMKGRFFKIDELVMLSTNLENWSLIAKEILTTYQ